MLPCAIRIVRIIKQSYCRHSGILNVDHLKRPLNFTLLWSLTKSLFQPFTLVWLTDRPKVYQFHIAKLGNLFSGRETLIVWRDCIVKTFSSEGRLCLIWEKFKPTKISLNEDKEGIDWHNYRSSATTICHVFRNWIGTGRGRSGLRNGVLIINKGDREKSYIVYCLSIQLLWKCFHYHKGKNTSFNEDFECRAIVCIGVSTSPPPPSFTPSRPPLKLAKCPSPRF